MELYHFDLVDSQKIADADGHPCTSFPEAVAIANGLAVKLAREEPQLVGLGYAISVKNERDEEVYRAEIDNMNRRQLSH
jgi:hypothetical protein